MKHIVSFNTFNTSTGSFDYSCHHSKLPFVMVRMLTLSVPGCIFLLAGVRSTTEDAAGGQRRDPCGLQIPGRSHAAYERRY
jgi:hypothetical protein